MRPCSDNPELWFSDEIYDIKRAKKICNADCALLDRAKCLQIGLTEGHGVFGGKSVYERRKLRIGLA